MSMNEASGGFLPSIKSLAPIQIKDCVLMLAGTIFRKEMGYCKKPAYFDG